MPLSRRESLRKKLRAQGQLTELWKSQNLNMDQCSTIQSANEPLINYLDVRPPGMGAGEREKDSFSHFSLSPEDLCRFCYLGDLYGLIPKASVQRALCRRKGVKVTSTQEGKSLILLSDGQLTGSDIRQRAWLPQPRFSDP